jgi:PHD/YefM family antitoxin component YafN of YafNO toxin-antitoxin module
VKTTLNISEVQAQLPRLVRSKRTVTICRKGETVAFLVSRERMESIFESLEVLSNGEAMKAVRRARTGRGKYIPLQKFEKEMDEDAGRAYDLS